MAIPGFGEIAEQLRRSTVLVHSGGRGSGSGVIWSSDGLLVTNAHVVRLARPTVQLWDGREFEAAVHSRDPLHDLARLHINATNLPAASVANSSQLRAGELAIAIGNPMGFVGALATGVIHGVGPLRGLGSHSWVQAEVRLAPGNSGGPLANARGQIVGINTMVAGRLALAIPSNTVRDFLSASLSDGRLGVTVHPALIPRPASRARTFGLVILEVEPDSPAAQASLLPGDILLGTEEKAFAALEDLARAGLENLLVARGIEVTASVAGLDELSGHLDDTPAEVILIDSTGETFEPFLDSLIASGVASDFTVMLLAEPASLATSSAALRAGVRAVLPNDVSPEQLVAALQAAASGLLVLHPTQVSAQVNSNGFASSPARSQPLDELTEAFTPREGEVLQMLASGLANKQIAAKLAISEHTVKFHVASILGKLGAASRTEAVSLGIRRGLVLL